MNEPMKQLVTHLIAALNAHDVERAAAFYAPDYEEVDVAQAAVPVGPDGIRRTLAYYLCAFPDVHFTLDDLITEGKRTVLVWTLRGTHRGTFMHIPPTGRSVTVRGTSLLTIEDGKVRRGLRIWDLAGLLRAIGLLPEL